MLLRFKELYAKEIVKSLQQKFNYKNVHQMPKLSKIVVNKAVS